MKVSVLITTYNLEKYIEKTLKSVLDQKTDFEYEILVGDDGSDDKTVEIVKTFQKTSDVIRDIYIMPRDNKEVVNRVERSAANRINLLKHAKGEYVLFLDGDDFYTDDCKLSKQVKVLDDSKNSDCIICTHNMAMYYETANSDEEDVASMPRLCRAMKDHKWSLQDYWPVIFIQSNAMMFRNPYMMDNEIGHVLIEELDTNEGLKAGFDDNNITFWLLRYGKMYYLHDVMVAYRQSEGSSWNAIDELKKHCSNMVGYSLCKSLYNGELSLLQSRFYDDFKFLFKNRDSLCKEACMPFYETAKKCDLNDALDIYDKLKSDEAFAKTFLKMMQRAKRVQARYKAKRAVSKILKRY